MCKYFARMLNSQGIKFANISESKVLMDKSEFTVSTGLMRSKFHGDVSLIRCRHVHDRISYDKMIITGSLYHV